MNNENGFTQKALEASTRAWAWPGTPEHDKGHDGVGCIHASRIGKARRRDSEEYRRDIVGRGVRIEGSGGEERERGEGSRERDRNGRDDGFNRRRTDTNKYH